MEDRVLYTNAMFVKKLGACKTPAQEAWGRKKEMLVQIDNALPVKKAGAKRLANAYTTLCQIYHKNNRGNFV